MTKPMQANAEFMARALPRIAAGRVGTPDDLAAIRRAGFTHVLVSYLQDFSDEANELLLGRRTPLVQGRA